MSLKSLGNKNVLLVGVNSFLARHLTPLLSEMNLYGFATSSLSLHDKSLFIKIFTDTDSAIQTVLLFDYIFIIGAYIPYGSFDKPSPQFVNFNIDLVAKLSFAYPRSRIIFASSTAVYGTPLYPVLNESGPFNNPNLYGLSKLAGEAIIRNHLSYCIIRFSSLWGKGMHTETFLPRIVRQARNGQITIFGKGERKQNYLHVNDAAQLCVAASGLKSNCSLLGVDNRSYSNKEIAELVADHFNCPVHLDESQNEGPSFEYDNSYTKSIAGFLPVVSLKDNITELFSQYD